jgi:hypothetical protein
VVSAAQSLVYDESSLEQIVGYDYIWDLGKIMNFTFSNFMVGNNAGLSSQFVFSAFLKSFYRSYPIICSLAF